MNTTANRALTAALIRLLRPLVRLLLRYGVSYQAFADLARWAYVDVASREFAIPGRKQTVSRVSVLTGLNRKEVSRLQATEQPDDTVAEQRHNRATRVINGWLRDPRFQDETGHPAALPFEGGGERPGITDLVRAHSGDMPPRAVVDELERTGAVQADEDERYHLAAEGYVPGGEVEKLHILGSDVAELVATIDYNLHTETGEPHFQRKVAYNNLPAEALPALRELAAERSGELLLELNEWLAARDRDTADGESDDGDRHRAGLAIYYFEDPDDAPRDS
jgi:hypothetical protein